MYPIPSNETLIETKTCRHCGTSFPITNKDIEMLEKLSPTIGGNRYLLPNPTLCPNCRLEQGLAWRNEKKIYWRKSDTTGKMIISMFHPEIQHPIFEESIWNSDYWDAKKYGRDFDFFRSFFEQFHELLDSIPLPATYTSFMGENTEYSNNCGSLKNCYLCFNAQDVEDSLYSIDIWDSSYIVDCLKVTDSELCYEVNCGLRCYKVFHSFDVTDCRDSTFLYSCEGCKDCYGCYDLLNQQYCIFNKEYSKEDYQIKRAEYEKLSLNEQKKLCMIFLEGYIKKPLKNLQSENVHSSENIHECKDVFASRNLGNADKARYTVNVHRAKDVMDYCQWGNQAERIYASVQVGNGASSVAFTISSWGNISNLMYCFLCVNNVRNCFGCVGLMNGAEYCILNKQYTKEEYESLVPKIIEHMMKTGEWGSSFPASFSPLGYNETVLDLYHPRTPEEAEKAGFNWSDYEPPFPKVEKIIPAHMLPDDIVKIPDDILNWAIECEVTKKPFRIVKAELDFYRKHNLPIPKRHPDQRHLERVEWHSNY